MPRTVLAALAVAILATSGIAWSCRASSPPSRTVTVIALPHPITTTSTRSTPPIDWQAGVRYAVAVQRAAVDRYLTAIAVALAEQAKQRSRFVPNLHPVILPRARPSYSDDALVLRIGRCEQPGSGWQGIAWTHHGSYNGGLGILNVNWLQVARELGLPSPAYLATPAQQIAGAERLAADVGGWNGWGCYKKVR